MSQNNPPQLTAKQIRAINSLVESPSVADAAAKLGMNVRTLFRWLNNELFAEAYKTARGKLFEDVLSRLQSASIAAVTTLHEITTDTSVNAFARVSAARGILELMFRGRELVELETRLQELEKRMNPKK